MSVKPHDVDFKEIIPPYLERVNSLDLAQTITIDTSLVTAIKTVAGGVYALELGLELHLFAPGSASREVPYKNWEIEIPMKTWGTRFRTCFCPSANVVAFAEIQEE